MGANWIDAIIILVIGYYIYEGWTEGLASLLANLGSFLISLWLAVRFHGPVGQFIIEKFGIAAMWASVLGYIIIAVLSQVILEAVFLSLVRRLPEKFQTSNINHWLGGFVSLVNGLVIVSFFLLLILAFPLRGSIKADIRSSTVGTLLVKASERYGGSVTNSLEEAAKLAVRFLTVEPGSRESIPVDVPTGLQFSEDAGTESQMVNLVNKERTSRGLNALTVDSRMTEVARGKSLDMFKRRYFSHYDPDGKNAADRMTAAGIPYTIIGENLAYAPDLASAHEGLMNSEGHKANILDPRFHRIGIGVIDGGIYGKMFTQEFAD